MQLNDTAIYLFSDEFRLHLPGGPYPFPAPAVVAFLSACGEVGFPVLLMLGLGTRFAATGLFLMTCIIAGVGLLPAAVMGLDVRAMLLGAATMTRRFIEEPFEKYLRT